MARKDKRRRNCSNCGALNVRIDGSRCTRCKGHWSITAFGTPFVLLLLVVIASGCIAVPPVQEKAEPEQPRWTALELRGLVPQADFTQYHFTAAQYRFLRFTSSTRTAILDWDKYNYHEVLTCAGGTNVIGTELVNATQPPFLADIVSLRSYPCDGSEPQQPLVEGLL